MHASTSLSPKALDAVERVNRLAYSPGEAADALGVSRAFIYQLLQAGTLPSIQLGKRRLVPVAALVELLEAARDGEA